MLIQELPSLFDGVSEVVDLSPAEADLRTHLRLPEEQTYGRYDAADPEKPELGRGTLVIGLIGPDPTQHTDPADLAPLLRRLPTGAQVLLVAAWPILEFPHHRLLGPLVESRCQVVEAVTVDHARRHGFHLALVIRRVDALVTPRPHLLDHAPGAPAATDERPDELATVLRMANEYVMTDLIARPTRRRVMDLEERTRELGRKVEQLEAVVAKRDTRLQELERRLAAAQQRMANLQSSTTFQVGRVVVDGARRPGRAVVSVPVSLARMWQLHRSRKGLPPGSDGAPGASSNGHAG